VHRADHHERQHGVGHGQHVDRQEAHPDADDEVALVEERHRPPGPRGALRARRDVELALQERVRQLSDDDAEAEEEPVEEGAGVADVVGETIPPPRPEGENKRGEEHSGAHQERAPPRLVVPEESAAPEGEPAVERALQAAKQVTAQHPHVQERSADDRQEDPERLQGALA
jgi:hypothetical protein